MLATLKIWPEGPDENAVGTETQPCWIRDDCDCDCDIRLGPRRPFMAEQLTLLLLSIANCLAEVSRAPFQSTECKRSTKTRPRIPLPPPSIS